MPLCKENMNQGQKNAVAEQATLVEQSAASAANRKNTIEARVSSSLKKVSKSMHQESFASQLWEIYPSDSRN